MAAAIEAGLRPDRIFLLAGDGPGHRIADRGDLRASTVTARVLSRIGTTESPQSPIAVLPIPESPPPSGGRVLTAWGVSDPGNVGTLVRVAAAFGYGFMAGPGTSDLWSPKVLRAGSGAHFRTPVAVAADMEAIRDGGRTVVATVARGGAAPGALPPDAALVIGSEAHGLPPEVVEGADLRITIPMRAGTESLNAAAAGAIVAFLGAGDLGTNLPAR